MYCKIEEIAVCEMCVSFTIPFNMFNNYKFTLVKILISYTKESMPVHDESCNIRITHICYDPEDDDKFYSQIFVSVNVVFSHFLMKLNTDNHCGSHI